MLNPWNPLSPLRLLLWLLLRPAQAAAFRAADERTYRIVGSWLTSGLTWFPLLIPLLGYGLGSIPGATPTGVHLAGVVLLIWLLTGFLGTRTSEIVAFMAGALTFFVMLGIAFTIAAGVTPGLIAGFTLGGLGILARGIGVVAGGHLAAHVAGGLAGGIIVATVTLLGGGILAGIILAFAVPLALLLVVVLALSLSHHLTAAMQHGRPAPLDAALLALLPLGLLLLVWLYFLGGWQQLA